MICPAFLSRLKTIPTANRPIEPNPARRGGRGRSGRLVLHPARQVADPFRAGPCLPWRLPRGRTCKWCRRFWRTVPVSIAAAHPVEHAPAPGTQSLNLKMYSNEVPPTRANHDPSPGWRRRKLEHGDLVRRAETHHRAPGAGAGGDVEHRGAGLVAAGDAGEVALHEPVERHDLPVVGMSAEHPVRCSARNGR